MKRRYAFMKDNDGCDNVWVIYDGIAGKDITQITFWDCEPNWTARTKAAGSFNNPLPERVRTA